MHQNEIPHFLPLKTMVIQKSTQVEIFIIYTVIWKSLELQLTLIIQFRDPYILVNSKKNDTNYLHLFNAYIIGRKNIISECYGRIGHKYDSCIICGRRFLPLIIRRKMNQFNALHGDNPTEPPQEWNNQPPAAHFKYIASAPKLSTML